jgi:ATP-dependent DNA helicase RecQ
MPTTTRDAALIFLRQALQDPNAEFRESQYEAIEELVERRKRVLVIQRTGWGKSLVYFIATRLLRTTVRPFALTSMARG